MTQKPESIEPNAQDDMRIELHVTTAQPPTGVATGTGNGEISIPFAGWMGMLRALSTLLGETVPIGRGTRPPTERRAR